MIRFLNLKIEFQKDWRIYVKPARQWENFSECVSLRTSNVAMRKVIDFALLGLEFKIRDSKFGIHNSFSFSIPEPAIILPPSTRNKIIILQNSVLI
jgi:hypothetical protein